MKVHITGEVISSKKSITVTEELVSGKNVLITGNPIFNDQNEIIAVVTNVRDISEIISLEKKERLAKEIISRYQKQIFDTATMKNIICESSNTISVFNFAAKVAPKIQLYFSPEKRVWAKKSLQSIYTITVYEKIITILKSTAGQFQKIYLIRTIWICWRCFYWCRSQRKAWSV